MRFLKFIVVSFLTLSSISQAFAFPGDTFVENGIVYEQLMKSEGVNCVAVTYDKDKFYQDPDSHKFIGTTYSGNVEVPSTVKHNNVFYTVTEIATNAFHGCQDLTGVRLPESIKVIGIEAFRNCPKLSSINFPEGLETIYYDAFTHDDSLTEIVLPSSLKLIDAYAFCECRGLKRVVLKDSDIPLEKPTYYSCAFIFHQIDVDYAYIGRMGADEPVKIDTKELVLGNSITSLDQSFFNPLTLEKITIPPSVQTIRKGTFKDAVALKDINIQDGEDPIYLQRTVNSINNRTSTHYQYLYPFQETPLEHAYIGRPFNPDYNSGYTTDYDAIGSAFSYAKNLKTVKFGPAVTRLFNYSFLRCENLETVDFSNAPISQIDEGCFSDCYELTSVVLPETVKSLKTRAFDHCVKLTEVYLPQGLTEIGDESFTACAIELLTIPGNVKTIGREAFASNRNLRSLKLENGIEVINYHAFIGCSSLKELSIPGSVILLCNDSFRDLSSLTSLRFENGDLPLNCEYSAYGSSYGKNCQPVFTNSTKGLKQIYIDRDFSFDHFSGNNQYVHDYIYFFGEWSSDQFGCSPIIEYGPTVFGTATGMFKRFSKLNKVVCFGTSTIPYCHDTFYRPSFIDLYVPRGYVNTYTQQYFWKDFASVQNYITPVNLYLDNSLITLKVGESLQLITSVYPADATFINLEWTSSDETVAVVQEDGLITAYEEGTAEIRVNLANNPSIYAQCEVVVTSLTGTAEINADGIRFLTAPRTLTLQGIDDETIIHLYDMGGNSIFSGNSTRIEVDQPGIYILLINNTPYLIRL